MRRQKTSLLKILEHLRSVLQNDRIVIRLDDVVGTNCISRLSKGWNHIWTCDCSDQADRNLRTAAKLRLPRSGSDEVAYGDSLRPAVFHSRFRKIRFGIQKRVIPQKLRIRQQKLYFLVPVRYAAAPKRSAGVNSVYAGHGAKLGKKLAVKAGECKSHDV